MFVEYHNTPKRKVQVVDTINIDKGKIVNLTRLGSVHAEVVYMTNEPQPGIRKLNAEEYIVIKSGQIRKFKQNEGKVAEHLRKVFKTLQHLIKTNFDTEDNEHNALFITLTYAENMQDSKKLYEDFKKFILRLKYEYSEHDLQYIAVAEPQARGAWHMHVLLKSDKPVLYIDNVKLSKIWGHGFTETERIKGKDPGKYFAAYFTNLEADATGKETDPAFATDSQGKKYKKGARLGFYPKGMNFYRCSRGITRPSKELALYGDVTHEYGKPILSKSLEVHQFDDSETLEVGEVRTCYKVVNTLSHEEFRKNRKKNPNSRRVSE
jgi:hypothetical protein